MSGIIRKISVGVNLPDGAMHYQLGSKLNLQGHSHVIVHIGISGELAEAGKFGYDVYVSSGTATYLWKTLVDVPMTVEYKLDFE